MAHECPDCGMSCHCNGDIDDMDIGLWSGCGHCPIVCPDADDDEWYEDVSSEDGTVDPFDAGF